MDDIPLDKIVEPHRNDIVVDASIQNAGSPVNDCSNVGPGSSLPVTLETSGSNTSVDEVKTESSKQLEEESDDITNSLFGKCGKCAKPKPGTSYFLTLYLVHARAPRTVRKCSVGSKKFTFFSRKTVWLSACLLRSVYGKTYSEFS